MKNLLDCAFDAYDANNFETARELCLTILQQDEFHVGAHYLLGTLHAQMNEFEQAINHLTIAADHDKSDKALPLFNLALTLARAHKFSAAHDAIKTYLHGRPHDLHGKMLLAEIYLELGEATQALYLSDTILLAHPELKKAELLRAKALDSTGHRDDAIVILTTLCRDPELGYESCCCLAFIESERENFASARSLYEKAVKMTSHHASALSGLGIVLTKMGEIDEALNFTRQAVASDPTNSECLINHAIALQKKGEISQAIAFCKRALEIKPRTDFFQTQSSMLYECGDFVEANIAATRAIELDPKNHDAYYMRGITSLLLGAFESGWRDYEHRLDASWTHMQSFKFQGKFLKRALRFPSSDQIKGRNILLIEEQGIGDTLMFSSMLDDVLALCKRARLVIDPRLRNLILNSYPHLDLSPPSDLQKINPSDFDHIIFMGSLGHAFRQNTHYFPRTPYLHVNEAIRTKWSLRLKAGTRRKIGLAWRGGGNLTNKNGRTLALEDLQPLLERDDLVFCLLQHDAQQAEIEQLHELAAHRLFVPAKHEIEDIEELGGLICSLDDVVTTQNTNVHICGALGISCKAILPIIPTWSYGLGGSEMIWYQSVELFRRSPKNTTRTVIEQIMQRI